MRLLIPCAGLFTLLAAPNAPTLPAVHAQLLSGTAVNLPEDLHGRPTVIVIGFSQGSREEVAAWGRRLAPDYRDAQDVGYFEVAELEAVPRLLRGYVLKKIRETVPERAQPHFLTVTEHEAEWKSATSFADSSKDDAYVVIVDPEGQVRYTTHGAVSDAGYGELKRQLEPLRARR